MFSKRTIMAVLFAIAMASSLVVASGFIGSAFAAKKGREKADGTYTTMSDGKDKLSGPMPQVDNLGNSGASPQDSSGVSASDLKKLSNCESGAAEDGDLTLAELKDCYSQMSDQG
jgi:hypothetical protein